MEFVQKSLFVIISYFNQLVYQTLATVGLTIQLSICIKIRQHNPISYVGKTPQCLYDLNNSNNYSQTKNQPL